VCGWRQQEKNRELTLIRVHFMVRGRGALMMTRSRTGRTNIKKIVAGTKVRMFNVVSSTAMARSQATYRKEVFGHDVGGMWDCWVDLRGMIETTARQTRQNDEQLVLRRWWYGRREGTEQQWEAMMRIEVKAGGSLSSKRFWWKLLWNWAVANLRAIEQSLRFELKAALAVA
jgi:hypothetical protein